MGVLESIRSMGSCFDASVLKRTRDMFEPLWTFGSTTFVKMVTAPYGSDERQVADIYGSDGVNQPVLIFIPGGGFTGGSRSAYRAFANYFVAQGFIVVIADYRLAPMWKWPSGAEDVLRVVQWTAENASFFGGCAENIFVLGHSAGSTHLASAIYDRRLHSADDPTLRGFILISGIYHLDPGESRPNILSYFGEDRENFTDRLPLAHVKKAADNVLLVMSEYDPVHFVFSAFNLASSITRCNGKPPKIHMAEGHNHISSIFAVGSQYDSLAPVVQRFIADVQKISDREI